MPLQTKDQLTLLADILRTHQLDRCGSQSECEQLERLSQSLLENPETPLELRETLTSIHAYSQQGGLSSSINDHIHTYQTNLTDWMTTLEG